MPPSPANPVSLITGIFNGLIEKVSTSPWNLRRLEDFPFVEWSNMQEYYRPLIEWYEGVPLNERITDKETGVSVDKFPIKLNPIPSTCEKHTSVLWGNTLESIRHGGIPVQFIPESEADDEKNKSKDPSASKPGTDGEKKEPAAPPKSEDNPDKPKTLQLAGADPTKPAKVAEEAKKESSRARMISDAVMKSFKATGGGAMFVDAGITSQYMGGCVWKVKFDENNKDFPVQTSNIDPVEFFGIPKGNNFWELSEAWMVREITISDAKSYGYVWNGMDDKFYYVEHWTEEVMEVFINDKTIKSEPNIFEVVPFVYIPHIRNRTFIGKSVITPAMQGIIKEWNLRFGDIGDAVAEDAHAVLAVRGIRGNLSSARLPDGRIAVNLGTRTGMGTNETEPDLIAVKTQLASEPMLKFADKLESQYRKEAKHPAVSDGEDEGSQRSAATLEVRMWPLISHVELERINWTAGLLKLVSIILKFYAKKNLDGITEDMVNMGFTIKWGTPLPRDRETLVNELAIRKKNGMTSTKHILELLGDIEDVERELALIDAEEQQKHAMEMDAVKEQAKSRGFGSDSPGNPMGKNNQEKGDKTNTDAKNQIKKE